MIIPLNENWRLRSGPLEWIADQKKGKTWKTVAYFSDYGKALWFIAHRQILLIQGEFPAEALEALHLSLARIEKEVERGLRERPSSSDR